MADIQIIDEGNIIEIIQGRDLTVVMPIENGVEIEKLRFIQLADTPNSYENSAGKTLVVNEDGTGLIFSKNYDTFLALTDTPNSYENSANKLVVVNSNGTGLRFLNYTSGDITIENFTQLGDVPNSYTGKANYLVTVNPDEDGLAFIEQQNILPDQANVIPGSYKYPQFVINKKGVITNIQEGEPFEFDEFDTNKLLIGDGSTNPAQLPLGRTNQILITTDSSARPAWTFLDKLIDENGKVTVVASNACSTDSGVLFIENSANRITFRTDAAQTFKIGNGNAIILGGSTEVTGTFRASLTSVFEGDSTFNKKVTIGTTLTTGGKISSGGDIEAEGNISALGNITSSSDISAAGNLSTSRNLTVRGNAQVIGATILGGSVDISGATTIGDTLSVTGKTTLSGGLDIIGATNITGNTSIDGTLSTTGDVDFQSNATVDGNLNLTGNIVSSAGTKINPGTGTVGVTGVNAETYSARITHDNDFITKKYLDDQQMTVTYSYKKTDTVTITDQEVSISIPQYATILDINFDINSGLNEEAKLQVVDSDGITLFDSSDCPYLDSEGLKIFLNQHVNSTNYTVKATILDYSYGEGTIFITYFEGNS